MRNTDPPQHEHDLELENEFVRKLKAGTPDAYEALIERFEGPLYRYFLASHGNKRLAIEQSADCFGDLVNSFPKMSGGSEQLRSFVFAVARNVLRRSWRLQKRSHAPLDSEVALSDGLSPDKAAELREESNQLIEAIRLLEAPTRDVFLLRFIELMPVAEIAATVGEPIGTIKSRLSRGRDRLAQILQIKCERHD